MELTEKPDPGATDRGGARHEQESGSGRPVRTVLWLLFLYSAGLVLMVMEDMLSHANF